ncbi:hypothetical protein JKP88DRAFT_308779 [Tribonema minus]|uniref:CDP-diacylglycerol phosphatidylhydrolase n=1 Tax=Tribonema minus TaxID=303371 RepID=A0A835Z767_9STRA|nr:hypothetical protein JKP88DRAFT_308779 [Tribonema minus]
METPRTYLRTFFYSEVENPPGAPNPTWLIEPIVAIPGVENIYDGGKAILFSNHLWRQGFNDAVKGALGRPVIAANTLGLVINSARYRSQHQMHIHVSALSAEFASCLAALDLPAASPQLQWQPSTCTLRYFATTARAWLYAARVDTLDNVSGVAWEGMSGDGWADFIGGAAALTPRTDTAVALASAGDGDGYVVVLAAGAGDVGDHNMLDYDPPSAEAEAQAEAEAEAALLKDTAPPVDASV